jgi:hypothetical protein
MSTIVTRAGKGAPLTNTELDSNFTNLNTDKLEINAALGTPASVTLTNATGLPTAGLVDNAVTNAKLRDSAGLSVIGRGANSTGDPADIVAGTNKQVLRRDGSSLGFGAVDLSSNQAVTGTLPVNQGGTGITSFGAGVATWLGTPTSANLAAAVTDETGTGTLVFGTNPVIDGATIPARTNPLAQAVSVQMTASATVGGVQQLPGVNNNLGAGDFTLVQTDTFKNTGQHIFMGKRQTSNDAWYWYITTAGNIQFLAFVGGVQILNINGGAITAYYNKRTTFSLSVTRETATAAGAWAIYIDGVLFASNVIASAATVSLDNTGTLYVSARATGSTVGTTRTDSDLQASRMYNRALTAAEVLDLSINGVALADRGASQTPVYESDFSAGVDGHIDPANVNHVGDIDGIDGQDNWLRLTKLTNNGAMWTKRPSTLLQGSRYNYSLKVNNGTGDTRYYGLFNRLAAPVSFDTQSNVFVEVAAGATALLALNNFVAAGDDLYIMQTNSSGEATNTTNGDIYYVREKTATQIGLTSELLASNAQSNTGQIFDTSGNKNHALLPASGATVVGRPVSQTREVRWTNTWAGTNELQYIGGVNQAILPANAYIESIIGTVSGATPHDIIIGDGSDTDRYVTITTGLAAGTTNFALAARTTDGTNLKLTVDPDTDCSMSIAWVISYRTLE